MRKALLYILAIFTLMLCTLLSPTGGLAFECIKEGEDLTFANVEDALSNYYSNGYSEELWKLNVHPWIAFQAIEVLRRQDQSKYDIIKENAHMIVYGSVEEDYDHRGTATIWEYAHMEHTDKLDLFDDYSGIWDWDTFRYNSTRCLNHFSPKLTPKSRLTIYAATRVSYNYTDAIDWALNSDINLMSLKHAKDAYSQGELLRIWGHAIHILGDMGCPPHVRNDDHASPPPVTNTSVYEPKLGKISFSELDNYGGGSFDANSIPIKKLGSEREYLDQLADWTRKHFFSQGTMFSPDYPIKESWASWQWEPVYGRFIPRWDSPINVKTLYVAAHDKDTEEKIKPAVATLKGLTQYELLQEVRSLSGDALYNFGEGHANSFAIDEAVVQDFWRYSRSEIVGYAAGLINRLFDAYIGLGVVSSDLPPYWETLPSYGVVSSDSPLWETLLISIGNTINFSPRIAMTPMSGPPGTTFIQGGLGFSPNSTATLHFEKPDGTEYPTQTVNLDNIGHFEVNYTAPMDKPLGTYTWWAVDDTTGIRSSYVSYDIILFPFYTEDPFSPNN